VTVGSGEYAWYAGLTPVPEGPSDGAGDERAAAEYGSKGVLVPVLICVRDGTVGAGEERSAGEYGSNADLAPVLVCPTDGTVGAGDERAAGE
jgi:hypothetical protein